MATPKKPNINSSFAEVIESSLEKFLGQSWQWDHFPDFGSLVAIEGNEKTIFGIVHQIQTGSMDQSRHPIPYKKTEKELLQEHPQIFSFLKTTFSCLVVGYQEHATFAYTLAPQPAKIHSFIQSVSPELSKQFFSSHGYLPLLFGGSQELFNLDELLLALIRQHLTLSAHSESFIANFIETFSLLTGNDYRRLKIFLQRVEQVSSTVSLSRNI